jgi:hypothetical protein
VSALQSAPKLTERLAGRGVFPPYRRVPRRVHDGVYNLGQRKQAVSVVTNAVAMWWYRKYNGAARLDGKTAVVTGSNTGIGKFTVMDFVKRGKFQCEHLYRLVVTETYLIMSDLRFTRR